MIYRILTIYGKIFLKNLLMYFSFSCFVFTIGLTSLFDLNVKPILFSASLFLILLGIFFSLNRATKITNLEIQDNHFIFDGNDLLLDDLCGYLINTNNPIFIQFELRDNIKDYKITTFKYCSTSRNFDLFLSDLISKTQCINPNFTELSFYDFHPKQFKHFNKTLIFDLIIVILINIAYLYFSIFKGLEFNWKILLLNFLFINYLYFHNKNKKMMSHH
jgi:hypothetical protein